MSDPREGSSRAESAEALFGEYLAARDEGSPIDVEALCTRAGPEAPELRSRLRAFAVLVDLGAALRVENEPRASADALTASGARLGRYENLRLLGEGGLSRVYVARDPELERDVALKVIATEHVSIDSARAWIRQEGRTLARLEHPGVVRVFEMGDAEGSTYVAMELVDGPSLVDVLAELRARRDGSAEHSTDLRVCRAAQELAGIGARATLALGICRALEACHAGGVLHRDVKPGNVLLESGVRPKLIDFGLAHLEESDGSLNRVTQRLIGTPAYIAPEQVESGQTGADPRSDQFSFGVLLYELLTLTTPFQRGTRTQTLDAVARALPPPPKRLDGDIPQDLETICLHALERDPRDRYASMQALADDLAAFIDHRAISIAPPSVTRRLRLWSRRNRRDIWVFGIPSALALAVLAASHVLDVRADAAHVAERIATARAELARGQDPIAIQSAFQSSREIQVAAAQITSRFLAVALVPDVSNVASGLVRETSDRLHELLAAERSAIAKLRYRQYTDAENEILHRWESALTFDAALCPECPANQVDRDRGRVDIPVAPVGTKLEISRAKPGVMPFLLEFKELESVRSLTLGEYRVAWLDDDDRTLAEFDLQIQRRAPRAQLVLEPIPASIRMRIVRVPAGRVQITSPGPEFDVAEFWATTGWFTGPDVQSRATERALSVDDTLEAVEGRPGERLFAGHAAYFARGASMRLPSVAEAVRILDLIRAGESGLDPLPAVHSGEFCSSALHSAGRSHLSHRSGPAGSHRVEPLIEGGTPPKPGYAFRLAISREPSTKGTP